MPTQKPHCLALALLALPTLTLAQTAQPNSHPIGNIRGIYTSADTAYALTTSALYSFNLKSPTRWTALGGFPPSSVISIAAATQDKIYFTGTKTREGIARPAICTWTIAYQPTQPHLAAAELPSSVAAFSPTGIGISANGDSIAFTNTDGKTWIPTPILENHLSTINHLHWINNEDFLAAGADGITLCHPDQTRINILWTIKDSGRLAQSSSQDRFWLMPDTKTFQERSLKDGSLLKTTAIAMPDHMNIFQITTNFICSSDPQSFCYLNRDAKPDPAKPLAPTIIKNNASEIIAFAESPTAQLIAFRADGKCVIIKNDKPTLTDILCDNTQYERMAQDFNSDSPAPAEIAQMLTLLHQLPPEVEDELLKDMGQQPGTPTEKLQWITTAARKLLAATNPNNAQPTIQPAIISDTPKNNPTP